MNQKAVIVAEKLSVALEALKKPYTRMDLRAQGKIVSNMYDGQFLTREAKPEATAKEYTVLIRALVFLGHQRCIIAYRLVDAPQKTVSYAICLLENDVLYQPLGVDELAVLLTRHRQIGTKGLLTDEVLESIVSNAMELQPAISR